MVDECHSTETKKMKVIDLFEKHKSIFPTSDTNFGQTNKITHKIKLLDNEPFKEKYRPVPPEVYNKVREHLQEMLDAQNST